MRPVLVAVLLALLPGCSMYSGGDDADDDCLYGADAEYAPYQIVNPETLVCEDWGIYDCPDACGPCAWAESPPMPSWGLCDSECRALDEGTCLVTDACRAVYDWACYTGDGPCTAEVAYGGCYPVDMSGPIQGACEGLDAWSCSQHDDCVALHDSNNGLAFVACAPEAPGCGAYLTEEACAAAAPAGCIPAYAGTDCTCDAAGNCTCSTWTFSACVEQR